MSKLPNLTGKELIFILAKTGFSVIRQKGSHVFLQHKDGRTTVVPVHGNEDIGKGLLLKILKDVELDRNGLIELIQQFL